MDVLGAASPTTAAAKTGKISTASDLVPCRFCQGDVSPDAIKCRHCGEFLSERAARQRQREQAAPKWSPGVAAVLSLFLPGAGQIYKGRLFSGLAWLVAVPVGYLMFIVPGVILHVACVALAYSGDPKS